MAPPLADLLASPDWYLHAFEGDEAVFVAMDRAAYRRSIFLDARISPAGEKPVLTPVTALLPHLPEPQPVSWIFHVAHCGSTLLARALEEMGGGLVLREPMALRQVALAPDPDRSRVARALLSRRYDADKPTLIKANVPVNFLLPGLVEGSARAVFLHLRLRDYGLAILRSEQHRAWLRHLTGLLAAHLERFDEASDGERAAALWLAQVQRFAAALGRTPAARSLDGERFLAAPAASLRAAAQLFELTADAADRVAAGPLFATYSKRPVLAFDNAARLARRAGLEAVLENDLTAAEAWCGARRGEVDAATALLEARALV